MQARQHADKLKLKALSVNKFANFLQNIAIRRLVREGELQPVIRENPIRMNRLTLACLKAPFQRVALAFLAASAVYADVSFSFQNGVTGYSGAKDVSINTQYSQYNGGNGVLWRGDPELGCYSTTGTGAYSVRYLLKFGNLTIPTGSTVVSATLSISLDSWNAGSGNISGFYLNKSWNGASSRIGWLHRDDSNDWAAPGASSAGVDTVAGKTFRSQRCVRWDRRRSPSRSMSLRFKRG